VTWSLGSLISLIFYFTVFIGFEDDFFYIFKLSVVTIFLLNKLRVKTIWGSVALSECWIFFKSKTLVDQMLRDEDGWNIRHTVLLTCDEMIEM